MKKFSFINSQLIKVAPFPVHGTMNGNISIKLHSSKGESKWIDISPDLFKKLELLLTEEAL